MWAVDYICKLGLGPTVYTPVGSPAFAVPEDNKCMWYYIENICLHR